MSPLQVHSVCTISESGAIVIGGVKALEHQSFVRRYEAHSIPVEMMETSYFSIEAVLHDDRSLEKNVGQGTLITLTTRRSLALEQLPMEGAILRAHQDMTQTSQHTTLPDHLLILRTKVILNSLPTRQ